MLLLRYLGTFAVASLVTFGLFWIMQALIGVEGELEEGGKAPSMDFVRLKRETQVEEKKRELPDKKKPDKEPPPPDLNLAQNLSPELGADGFAPAFDSGVELSGAGGLGVGSADQDVVPLVRVAPQYPLRAAQRGIEGWVEVEFTISKTGAVKQPRVIAYYPSQIFNREALRAIQRWKYNPKVENGKAVERSGVTVRLAFQLAK